VTIDAGHLVARLRETGPDHQPDIPRTDYRYAHTFPTTRLTKLHTVPRASEHSQSIDRQGVMADHARHYPVRILLDYRPALRQRCGAGAYVHELAAALLAVSGAPPDVPALFSSSWRDRIDRSAVLGPVLADRRVPVR